MSVFSSMVSVLSNPTISPSMVVVDDSLQKRVRGITKSISFDIELDYDKEAKDLNPRHYDAIFTKHKNIKMRVQNEHYRSFYQAVRKTCIRTGSKLKTKLIDSTDAVSTYAVIAL